MLHPHAELRFVSDAIGYGVFATHDIPRGTITWVRDRFDQVFTPAQVGALTGVHQRIIERYGYMDGRGDTILCWDHGRYVNHSCAATCLSPGFDFEVAVRDIPKGTELTDDYGTLGIEEPFHCMCGAPECRGTVRPDDFERLAGVWDEQVRSVFPLLRAHAQPLWELVREKEAVEAVLAGRLPLPSGRVHHFVRDRGAARAPAHGEPSAQRPKASTEG